MTNFVLQEAEKMYIIHGIQDNIRGDGRACLDYRTIELETDVIASCNGSSIVKLADTKLLAGVKAELATPRPSAPDKGWIEVSIESTPHAHLEFEGRGGDDFSSDVSQLLTQACNNDKLLDLKKLCVIPGQQVWVLYVDIMVLGYGGNYIDAASIATKAALYDTKIQSVSVKCDGENEPEIEVSDDPYDVFSLDVSNLPVLITLYRVGSEFVVDASGEEEACSICKLVLAVSHSDTVLMKQFGGPGSLHIATIQDGIEVGQDIGITLQKQLLESLKSEKTLSKKKKSFFMLYTWLPSMTLCMSMLSNNGSSGVGRSVRSPPKGGLETVPEENRYTYTRYLDVVMMLVEAARGMEGEQTDNGMNQERIDNNLPDPSPSGGGAMFGCSPRPMDCEELFECGFTQSGVYRIWPDSRVASWGRAAGFPVYCDMDTDGGGWTVIQRRDDFGTNSDFFYKGWQSYKFGFGDLNYDFWLGNDKIFALSNQRRTTLRFDLLDFEGSDGYATYDDFYVDDESQGYRLHLGDYRGIIGDSFKGHNLCRFSTRDRDNDNNAFQNCALLYKGGWWYNNCHTVNLNGLYLKGQHDTYADGVNWYGWKGFKYSLRKTEMKIRSADFVRRRPPFVNAGPPTPPFVVTTPPPLGREERPV